MEARSMPMREVFFNGGDVHYVLPRFQRAYSWSDEHWQPLWDDVVNLQRTGNESLEHFMGSIVVIEEGMQDATMPVFTLVDGQQRLLTVSVLLRALTDLTDNQRLRRQLNKYMMNEDREGTLRYKLLPTQNYGDCRAWETLILRNGQSGGQNKSRIHEAYAFFRKEIVRALDQGDCGARISIQRSDLQAADRLHQPEA